MAAISFLLAVLLGAASFILNQAASEISRGTPWASDACGAMPMFCHHPEYLAYAAGGMLVVGIGAKLGSLAS